MLQKRRADGSWDFFAHLGTHFLSQYWLCLRWLNAAEPRLSTHEIERRLLATQKADGSWRQLEEDVDSPGELNATIFNYWFLKASRLDASDIAATNAAMDKARAYLRKVGGIEASSLFTKTFLALFGQYPWSSLMRIPYFLFIDGLPFNYQRFSQWVIPHLMPIAYLRANRVSREMGAAFSVDELWVGVRPAAKARDRAKSANPLVDGMLIRKILGAQQSKGSWGGYTVSTLLATISLRHFSQSAFAPRARLDAAAGHGLEFVSGLYLGDGDGDGAGAYLGCLMDGHYWDTLLAASAVAESAAINNDFTDVEPSARYLRATQVEQGGFPYGFDFEYAPDVDDTAEAILLLSRINAPGDGERVDRAIAWLRTMQNGDGGFGAFDRDNVGDPLLRRLTQPYQDSVDLFDDSSADSTGHVLDALACRGFSIENDPMVRKAVRYLGRTQDAELGAWQGRWGVNWIFGTACALVGLVRAGVAIDDPMIVRGSVFLTARQNKDGGFGETVESYHDRKRAGLGPSTPSQTAWVLWALCAAGCAQTESARRAARHLVKTFTPVPGREGRKSGWHDGIVTGTGHPGLLYMHYPSYAAAFPLYALSAYRRASATPQSVINKS